MSMCNKVRVLHKCRSKNLARYMCMFIFCLKFNIAALTQNIQDAHFLQDRVYKTG